MPTTNKTPTAGQLWIVLARCHKSLTIRVEQNISDAGLCLTDFMILEALLHKGPLTITEIQGKILLASGSMTAAVDRLEKKDMIVRREYPARPSCPPARTYSGRASINRAHLPPQHMAAFESLLSVLGDKEKRQTYASLKKLGLHAARTEKL